jgi:hypothetical protein
MKLRAGRWLTVSASRVGSSELITNAAAISKSIRVKVAKVSMVEAEKVRGPLGDGRGEDLAVSRRGWAGVWGLVTTRVQRAGPTLWRGAGASGARLTSKPPAGQRAWHGAEVSLSSKLR